jgi:tRNA pseudouridine38-40 synthase
LDQRYFIELAFRGTEYHGWQYQPNAISIQQVTEETISILNKDKVTVVGAGRTDTGVHASYFVAHFDANPDFIEPLSETIRKLNHMLPTDIAVIDIFPVIENAHSRFSALSRTYKYFISRRKDPFRQDTSYFISSPLDIAAMNRASNELIKYDDFSSFCRSQTDARTHICKILHAGWEEKDNMLIFSIRANRFLRNMVRAIVGTMLECGYGKLTTEEFCSIIEAKDRRKAGKSALAQGLFLTDIEYPATITVNKNPKQ